MYVAMHAAMQMKYIRMFDIAKLHKNIDEPQLMIFV